MSPSHIRAVSLNCWGLKYISQHRRERIDQIGDTLAKLAPDIVGLQECFTREDFISIRTKTQHVLPYSKSYRSSLYGSGLAILSRWPIEETTMHKYTLNGRPTAFFRGDWFVGKGVACATVRLDGGELVDVFCTHLHAPYEPESYDSYLCQRISQAWELSKLLAASRDKGRLALALGDFNSVPSSLVYKILTSHGAALDSWKVLHPNSSLGSATDPAERERRRSVPTVSFNLTENGVTCDCAMNTWRMTENEKMKLRKGQDVEVNFEVEDPKAKRLDYIFVAGWRGNWIVKDARVGFVNRHPDLNVSLSDHFSVETTLEREQNSSHSTGRGRIRTTHIGELDVLPIETYDEILHLTDQYINREQRQRQWRIGHLGAQLTITIGCLFGVWWAPNYVSFALMLISSLGLGVGILDGLAIGYVFFSWELNNLREFRWEIEHARERAKQKDS